MTGLTVLPVVEKLSPYIWRILGCNPGPFTLQGTNTYLVGSEEKRILIDTGEADNIEYINVLKNLLRSENAVISKIIITHCHPDHIGGFLDVRRYVCKEETEVIKLPVKLNDSVVLSEYYKYTENPEYFVFVNDGYTLEIEDGVTLRIIATPGHTLYHACILIDELKVLFSGDCILGETSAVFEDMASYMDSLKNLSSYSLNCIYPGHGPVIQDPANYIKSYIKHREDRAYEIIKVLHNGSRLKPVDIVDTIYKNINEERKKGAWINVVNHLQYLKKTHQADTDGTYWWLTGLQQK